MLTPPLSGNIAATAQAPALHLASIIANNKTIVRIAGSLFYDSPDEHRLKDKCSAGACAVVLVCLRHEIKNGTEAAPQRYNRPEGFTHCDVLP